MRILFLHHSTGQTIWNAGLRKALQTTSTEHGSRYKIDEREFPRESPYGWNNYPYDYWNNWVNHGDEKEYQKVIKTYAKKKSGKKGKEVS